MERFDLVAADGVRLDAALHPSKDEANKGTILQVHGIAADMDEGGIFVRLAEGLADQGFSVLRFSFRGHGRSGGSQRGATIAGELLDLQAAIELISQSYQPPFSIVASSFGTVSVSLYLPRLTQLTSLVLWNPVLDLQRTFVNPELPWGLKNYSPQQQERLKKTGFLWIEDTFQLGYVMFEEMKLYDPKKAFVTSRVPALVIHGDQDTYVSYEIAKGAASEHSFADFYTVEGSDHGFDSPEQEEEAIKVTMDWLVKQHGK